MGIKKGDSKEGEGRNNLVTLRQLRPVRRPIISNTLCLGDNLFCPHDVDIES